MQIERGSWWRFMARVLVLGAVMTAAVFVGNRLANAGPGEPVRKALTVSGVISGVSGSTIATFRFFRLMGDTTPLCAPEVTIRDGMEREAATGAFSVEVPLDQSGAGRTCPDTLFHDPSAYVEVAIGGTPVVARRPINPVPYAVYAQQYGTPDCPVGYLRDTADTTVRGGASVILCRRNRDEVVRVGDGTSAFWVDRYEATVWNNPEGTGTAPANTDADVLTGMGLSHNGQWTWTSTTARPRAPLYALSVRGSFRPARYVTWFQAEALCRASGKRLPLRAEWLSAAKNTPDPDTASPCWIATTNTIARDTIDGDACFSLWGAQDMVGNIWEWTDEWYASAGALTVLPPATGTVAPIVSGRRVNDAYNAWGSDYGNDGTWNISSIVDNTAENQTGIPSAALRGGDWYHNTQDGVFALALFIGPSGIGSTIGFRCVIPR